MQILTELQLTYVTVNTSVFVVMCLFGRLDFSMRVSSYTEHVFHLYSGTARAAVSV